MYPSSLSDSWTDPGDMSISELSVEDQTTATEKTFDLSAATQRLFSTPDGNGSFAESAMPEDAGQVEHKRRQKEKLREEKLQSDLFVLRKLNAAFANFHEALLSLGSINQRIATQLGHTDALLNKYTGLLEKSDQFTQLVFDEEWQGADADLDLLERRKLERERKEAEELALAVKREKEEELRAEQERIQKETEREQEQKRMATDRGARGVRGTRTSTRGIRGSSRTATSRIGVGTSTRSKAGSTARTNPGNTSKLPMPSSTSQTSTSRPSTRDPSR